MISLKLKKILDEQKKSITEVHDLTQISRSTLTQMTNGDSKGIQFDTLNSLCEKLEVGVEDLIKFTPSSYNYDVKKILSSKNGYRFIFLVNFGKGKRTNDFLIECNLLIDKENTSIHITTSLIPQGAIEVINVNNNRKIKYEYDFTHNFNKILPLVNDDFEEISIEIFCAVLKSSEVYQNMSEYLDFNFSFQWTPELAPFIRSSLVMLKPIISDKNTFQFQIEENTLTTFEHLSDYVDF